MLDDTRAEFGEVILIDCHSMPHEAIDSIGTKGNPHPQIVLGDRFGAAAAKDVVDRIEAAFAAAGLRVARNTPFAGAYTAQHYGRPSKGQHVIQIEIDRVALHERTADPPERQFRGVPGADPRRDRRDHRDRPPGPAAGRGIGRTRMRRLWRHAF